MASDRVRWTRCAVGVALVALALVASASSALAGQRTLPDIEYARVDSISLRLDLYLPTPVPARPVPLVVWIHGGGWMSGSKEDCPAPSVLGDDYAVASIDYRFSQTAPFPAQLDDCKAAIRWLRANAGGYGYDPDRIGVWGASAGGHLAALLGTTGEEPESEGNVGQDLGISSRVQAVCDFCGPTDLTAVVDQLLAMDELAAVFLVSDLLGGPLDEKTDLARWASPIAHVDSGDPPFLIVHGEEDEIVPVAQATSFYEALASAGVDVSLCVVPGAGHCDFPSAVDERVRDFFARTLGAKGG